MSEENIIDLREFAKSLGIDVDAKRSCKSTRSFSKEWKELCLEIVEAYREMMCVELGRKRLGWLWVRNKIMEPFDVRRPDGKREQNPDLPELTRQNLESWALTGSLSDTKFEFIDYFVRTLSVESASYSSFEKAKRKTDNFHMAVFSKLYQPRAENRVQAEGIAKFLGRYLISVAVVDTWFRYLVVRIDYSYEGVIKATFAYCPFDPYESSEDESKNTVFYEGYLAPILSHLPDDEPNNSADSLQLGCFCLTKLFRPEFRGNHIDGYADGEMEIKLHIGRDMKILHHSIYLDAPNTLMAPSVFVKTFSHLDQKPEPTKEADLHRRGVDEEQIRSRIRGKADSKDEFKYKLMQLSDVTLIHKDAEEKFARIFANNYSGYLF